MGPMDASPSTPVTASITAPRPSWWRRLFAVFERLAVAHFAAYPIAFLWAAAAIPLTIHLSVHSVDELGGDLDSIGQFVVRRLVWPAGAAFLLAHVMGLLWVLSRDAMRGQRRCLIGLGGLAGVGVVGGALSWGWLLLR